MISESDVERAVTFLRQAENIAKARGEMVRADKMLHHIKALAMGHSNEKSAAAQERWAYASEQYRKAIDEYAEAVMEYERLKAKREAAVMLIEAWRTQESSRRGADRAA